MPLFRPGPVSLAALIALLLGCPAGDEPPPEQVPGPGLPTCDPVATVEAIYRHFGIAMTGEARAAMQASDEASKQGPRAPKHTYSLADYGLTAEQVAERFKDL